MSNRGSWHNTRSATPVASLHHRGSIDQPGPQRGYFHRSPLPAGRGTVGNTMGASAVDGLQGVGPAAYHYQHHHAIYPSERRQQTHYHHSHYNAAHLRMQTWSSTTLLSFLYQSDRRGRY